MQGEEVGGYEPANGIRFTVVIPLYNKAMFITETIRTVLDQSRAAAEIVCVDDGSTDGGAELVADRFPSVRLISQRNAGVGAARNTGLRHASGNGSCLLHPQSWPTFSAVVAVDSHTQATHTPGGGSTGSTSTGHTDRA